MSQFDEICLLFPFNMALEKHFQIFYMWHVCFHSWNLISFETSEALRGHMHVTIIMENIIIHCTLYTVKCKQNTVLYCTLTLPDTVTLPSLSDDQDISIQMRGGPEPLMVTGWAQILALDPSYRYGTDIGTRPFI